MNDYDFYKNLVNLTSDIIWQVDKNWCFTDISGRFLADTGYSVDEIIGKPIFAFMSNPDTDVLLKMLNGISSRKENIFDIEIQVQNKKQRKHYLLIIGIPLMDSMDRVKGYKGIARDKTDKKLIETALKESEDHISTLMHNLPGMAYRGSFKDDFRMEFVSDGTYPLSGYNTADFIEKRITLDSIIHPDEIKMLRTSVRNALTEKKQYEIIFRIITADTKIKWVMDKGFGIYKDGMLSGLEGFVFDITETKNAVDYSIKSERRFRNFFENNPLGVAVGNKEGYIIQTNKVWKKMFGYPEDYTHYIHISELRMAQDRDADILLFNSLFNGVKEIYRIERLFSRMDGSTLWCEVTASLTEDPDEKGLNVIGLYIDITERKKIEEELKRFREELESLVSERTEEINMLTQKVINSQEEERQRIARDLHDGVGQTILAAKYAFNSFIKISKIDNKFLDRGKTLIDIASQELREISKGIYPSMLKELGLKDTIDWFIRSFLETSGIKADYSNTITPDISYNLSLNIYRIIQELFNNIVKHSGAESVHISLSQKNQIIVIELSDNGKGFDIDKTKKTNTGSGLINVRQRVEFLKGHIKLESMPGRTWIKIELPMEQK